MTNTEDEQPSGSAPAAGDPVSTPAGDPVSTPAGDPVSTPGAGTAVPEESRQRLLANRYRLDSLLGRGSMGAVWKALDVVLGRSVAVKEVLLPPTQTDEENDVARERALREARSIAALSHPNVVTLYDVVEDDGRPWVVMELVPAKNLAEIIRDHGTLPPSEAARIGLAVLAALRSAHEVGITHRDVKPGNILVSPDGRVKLADFGISRRSEDSALTRTGLMVGSPSYIAPEVARGRPATSAADIWGLGATLQCAVEGKPPFDLGDPVATLTAVVGDPPQPAPHAGPLQPLIARMLEKDPAQRIRPEEVRQTLEAVVAERPAPRPTYSPPRGPLAPHAVFGANTGPSATEPAPRAGAGPGTPAPRPASPPPRHPGGQAGLGAGAAGYSGDRTGYRLTQPTASATRGPGGPPSQQTTTVLGGGGVYGAQAGPPAAYAATDQRHPRTGPHVSRGPSTGATRARSSRNSWIAALLGLVLAALVGTTVILWVSDDEPGGGTGSGAGGSVLTPTEPPTSNDTQITGTTATGAIEVDGVFRPFALELPEGWEVVEVAEQMQSSRSEFVRTDGAEDLNTMVKVTVVAEQLNGKSADDHVKAQMNQIGSPSKLPGFSEVSYEVTSQGNVLWQYQNVLQDAQRTGFLYATVRSDDVLWKVLTSGPSTAEQSTVDVANAVIKSFTA